MRAKWPVILSATTGSLLVVASRADLTLHMVDDRNEPVACEVYFQGQEGRAILLGSTDAAGTFAVTNDCHRLLRVLVVPVAGQHLSAVAECGSQEVGATNTILLTKVEFLANLRANAAWLEAEEQYADAALVHNEIYQRAKTARPGLASQAQAGVYEMFARSIGFPGQRLEYDPAQGVFVMTSDFELAVYEFQREQGLEETGRIDFATLRAHTSRKVLDYVTKRWGRAVPAAGPAAAPAQDRTGM